MNFIDEAKIYLKAGNGGDGCISFRREKFIDKGGPNGGDGGGGGSVIFQSNATLNTLINFRYKHHFKAGNGENGKGANRTGKCGNNIVLQVPVGTQIYSEDNNLLLYDFTMDGENFKLIQGGKGGLGNTNFKSSINQAPRKKTNGDVGEEMWVNLRLKLLSDVGLIGMPNAGKSTFLANVSQAKPKIANYPFTTLSPNLGVVYYESEEFVVADIPGLIENAHLGQGLGDRFLKHIERCNLLIHLIDATSEDITKDYKIVRNELEQYSINLKDKEEIICLNKADMLSEQMIQDKIHKMKKIIKNKPIFVTSSYQKKGLNDVIKTIVKIIRA